MQNNKLNMQNQLRRQMMNRTSQSSNSLSPKSSTTDRTSRGMSFSSKTSMTNKPESTSSRSNNNNVYSKEKINEMKRNADIYSARELNRNNYLNKNS